MSNISSRWMYYVRDAVESIRYSPGVNALAFGTLLAVLTVSGILLLAMDNLGSHLAAARDQIRVDVYLMDDISTEDRSTIRSTLAGTTGVSEVVYISQAQAVARYGEYFGSTTDLAMELKENPLPASFEVYLDQAASATVLAESLSSGVGGMEGVEEVRYDRRWLDRLDALLVLARAGGLAGGLAILVVVIFVVASVLRLAVFARREEIEIMLLVGATPGFVRGPFLVAGLGMGLISSLAALGLVELARQRCLSWVGETGAAMVSIVAGNPLDLARSGALVVAGVVVSLIASFVAVRQDSGSRQVES
jgi:cell division transport system permease protein